MNKLVQRRYKCKCGHELKDYVWDSDVHSKTFQCPDCGDTLGFNNIKVEKVGKSAAIRTPTKNR